jgi:hypothetical protein
VSARPYNSRQLAGDTCVVPGLTNAGYIEGLVIDTGEDEAPFAGIEVDRVAITHGHADHFSIAHALRDQGARVAAARDDALLVENPDINIRGMFSWAKPGDVLVTKLFRGVPCPVDEYLDDWDDERARVIPLPGHTVGHAVEVAAAIGHGPAVAVGMVAAGRASALVEGFTGEHRQRAVLEKLELPVTAPPCDPRLVRDLLGRDKKRDAAGLRMVVLADVAEPRVRHVDAATVDAALAAVGIT